MKGQKLFCIIFLATLLAAVLADYDDYYEDDYESESVYDRDSGYGGDSGGGINPLAAFIAPLAGLALLGAAAAVSINPVLVQLAVVGGGKRKKRDLMSDPNMQRKVTEIELLENFLTKETKFDNQAESMVAQYLECSGLSSDQNQCLERLVCIYASPYQIDSANKQEKDVIAIILYQLMSNKFIKDEIKLRMKYAGQLSKVLGGHCSKYSCPALDKH